jgi:hypothetical protein
MRPRRPPRRVLSPDATVELITGVTAAIVILLMLGALALDLGAFTP